MSRSINESLVALENARNDIVDALNLKIEGGGIEKTLKISEVAEKINSIEVGGGSSGFKFIENVSWAYYTFTSNSLRNQNTAGENCLAGNFKFTPKENIYFYYSWSSGIKNSHGFYSKHWKQLTKGVEYTLTFNEVYEPGFIVFVKDNIEYQDKIVKEMDLIAFSTVN